MTEVAVAVDEYAEKAVLGALMLHGDPQHVTAMTARGLRPEHFYYEQHGQVFTAAISLCDRQASIDSITLWAELERIKLRGRMERPWLDDLASYVPAAGHLGDYADRVMELAQWRRRQEALFKLNKAVQIRDADGWAAASVELESAIRGTRHDSLTPDQWASILFEHFSADPGAVNAHAIPLPWSKLNRALGGGLWPGEVCVIGGPTNHGKSVVVDQWLDHAAKHGKSCHLYMTEMTALFRGMRYISRRTGIPFMKQRLNTLSQAERGRILDVLKKLDYGCTIAADWDVEDIVRDGLRARYDFVAVDLLHGFHYEDERGLDRLSKAMQKLARTSTTLDGHPGTGVVAVTHLKEEGLRQGKVPRPTIASIKGGASIKQDADFVMFVWQDQDEKAATTGDGEIWLSKGRSSGLDCEEVKLNANRFRFDSRADERTEQLAESAGADVSRGDKGMAF